MLKLDAEVALSRGRLPSVGITTTTHSPDYPLEKLNGAAQALWRQLRREAEREGREKPEYCGFVEWTTGRGLRSGGHRRPHIHYLVKGLDPAAVVELEPRLPEMWKQYTGDAWIVDCKPLRTPAGAIQYLSLHNNKRKQAPPPGVDRLRRLRASKGYYEMPGWKLRTLAEQIATEKRLTKVVRVICEEGLPGLKEVEIDREFSVALGDALGDMVRHPAQLQPRLDGSLSDAAMELEIKELARRMCDTVQQRRARWPSRVVRLYEIEELDPNTGEITRRTGRAPIRKAA
jgi:hypothetical protein